MNLKRQSRVIWNWFLPALVLVISLFPAADFPGAAAYAAEDLSQLDKMAAGENYSALIQRVHGTNVPGGGFVFVVLGDSRSNMETARMVYRQAALEKPVFILHTGDVVSHGTVKEYLDYHLPLVEGIAPLPLIPVPGNHEEGPSGDFAGFLAIYGAERYSFDFAGCRFVGINNSGQDRLKQVDLQFLDRELSKPGAQKRFVVMHVPAKFVEQGEDTVGGKYRGFTEYADALRAMMARQRVQTVFFGHDHGYAARTIDGVNYIITGGAGAKFTEELAWIGKFHHYVVVHVDADGVWQELVKFDGGQWVRSKIGVPE